MKEECNNIHGSWNKFYNRIIRLGTAATAEQLEQLCPEFLRLLRTRTTTACSPTSNDADLQNKKFHEECLDVCILLASQKCSRFARKTGSAALRLLAVELAAADDQQKRPYEIATREEFLTLLDGLEEPQFHLITPIQPKLDILVDLVVASSTLPCSSPSSFQWRCLRLLFEKALAHPNGWVRSWALQKTIKLPAVLHADHQFILRTLFPAINSNDTLWRLLERRELANAFADIGQMLANALAQCADQENLLLSLLHSFTSGPSSNDGDSFWGTCPLYFMSLATSEMFTAQRELKKKKVGIIDNNDDGISRLLPKWRSLFARIADIPQIPIRMATTINFFAVITSFWSLDCALQSKLIGTISTKNLTEQEATNLVQWAVELFSLRQQQQRELKSLTGTLPTSCKCKQQQQLIQVKSSPSADGMLLPEFLSTIPTIIGTGQQQMEEIILAKCRELLVELSALNVKHCPSAMAKTFDRIECMLDMLRSSEHLTTFSPDSSTISTHISQLLDTLYDACQEQRRTRNFVPSIQRFLRICFHPAILQGAEEQHQKEVLDLIKNKFFAELLTQSQLNPALALLLAEQLFNVHERLLDPAEFASELVSLATFGPIIKGEQQLLAHIYQRLYGDFTGLEKGESFNSADHILSVNVKYLPRERINLLHFCPHQCRLFAIRTICCCLLMTNTKISRESLERKRKFANAILRQIIDRAEQWNRSKSCSFGLSLAHRHKTRLAQLLLLLTDHVANDDEMSTLVFDHCVDSLLDTGQQWSIKLLTEWTLNRLFALRMEFFDKFMSLEGKFASHRLGSVCSWLNVVFHHISTPFSVPDRQKLRLFFTRFLPWATSQNFSVRCAALAALRLVWQRHIVAKQSSAELHESGEEGGEFSLVASLVQFDANISTGNSARVVEALIGDFYFAHFDPIRHFSLQAIFQLFPAKTGLPTDEQIPSKLLQDHFEPDFHKGKEFPAFFHSILCDDRLFSEASSLVFNLHSRSIPCEQSAPDTGFDSPDGDGHSNSNQQAGMITRFEADAKGLSEEVQRKLNLFPEDMIDTGHLEKGADDDDWWKKPHLIVCATLVSKPANLGGLCRTCEIFKVRTLCLSHENVVGNKEFKALSMNAENWQHIEQVKPPDLAAYLRQKRAQGYKCIAAEQTTRSMPLERFHFPDRSILLLGEEREGVVPELLALVDATVEISQLGRTRSLNVHVSAALCIHKFAEQWLMHSDKK